MAPSWKESLCSLFPSQYSLSTYLGSESSPSAPIHLGLGPANAVTALAPTAVRRESNEFKVVEKGKAEEPECVYIKGKMD